MTKGERRGFILFLFHFLFQCFSSTSPPFAPPSITVTLPIPAQRPVTASKVVRSFSLPRDTKTVYNSLLDERDEEEEGGGDDDDGKAVVEMTEDEKRQQDMVSGGKF